MALALKGSLLARLQTFYEVLIQSLCLELSNHKNAGEHRSGEVMTRGSVWPMSIQEISAEELAKLFHLYHEALVHGLERPTDAVSGDSWGQLPERERRSMIAAARLALLDLAAAVAPE